MAVRFTVHPDRGFAHIRFLGHITTAETLAAAQDFAATPGVQPSWHHIIDFTRITGYERDYLKLMALTARLPDHLLHPGHEPLFVYVAPTVPGQEIFHFVTRSMQGIQGPLLRLTTALPEALALLGLPETMIDQL